MLLPDIAGHLQFGLVESGVQRIESYFNFNKRLPEDTALFLEKVGLGHGFVVVPYFTVPLTIDSLGILQLKSVLHVAVSYETRLDKY